ncbi:MAG: galactitol-1-phosphate 5-dehydrogenase [bacterium]|nr:galactitol-1-phosphate 5-dehydrogenase [bacterium]
MKACVLHGIGDLRCEDAPDPVPGAGEVLVRIRACGVCGSDIPRVFTKGTYTFPTIPGHEFSGVIAGVGDGVDSEWMGRGCAVFPLIPCKACAMCGKGEYALCEDYDYLGSRSDGAFAETVCAPVWNLVPMPEGVSFEAAAMVEPAAVAAHALRQGGVDLGDTVLIFGAGPIGLMLAQWAQAWGAAQTLLVDIDKDKIAFARGLGFTDVFNALEGDVTEWAMGLTGRGADLVIEAAGSAAALEQCMPCTRPFGRVVLMGNPSGEMKLSQDSYWAILRKELTVVGTWNSSYSDLPRNEWKLALDFMATGRLAVEPLITHRVGLEGLPGAMAMMRDRTEFSNKVMYVSDAGA